MNCCFRGHRFVKFTRNLEYAIKRELKALIEAGVTDFYSGGAYGWEATCELTVLKLRKKYPHIKLHLLLPCPAKEYTAEWSERQRDVYYKIMNSADSVEVLSEEYFEGCVEARDMRLVETADRCFCYCNEKNIGRSSEDSSDIGGTVQVVRMALEKGIDVINMCPVDSEDCPNGGF